MAGGLWMTKWPKYAVLWNDLNEPAGGVRVWHVPIPYRRFEMTHIFLNVFVVGVGSRSRAIYYIAIASTNILEE